MASVGATVEILSLHLGPRLPGIAQSGIAASEVSLAGPEAVTLSEHPELAVGFRCRVLACSRNQQAERSYCRSFLFPSLGDTTNLEAEPDIPMWRAQAMGNVSRTLWLKGSVVIGRHDAGLELLQ